MILVTATLTCGYKIYLYLLSTDIHLQYAFPTYCEFYLWVTAGTNFLTTLTSTLNILDILHYRILVKTFRFWNIVCLVKKAMYWIIVLLSVVHSLKYVHWGRSPPPCLPLVPQPHFPRDETMAEDSTFYWNFLFLRDGTRRRCVIRFSIEGTS